jgi:hypothetical protein
MRGNLCTPHPWNCAPPLPVGLGPKRSPLSLAYSLPPPAKLKARGRGFSGSTLKRAGSPFYRSRDLSVPDHEMGRCRLRFRAFGLPDSRTVVDGVRLTRCVDKPYLGSRVAALRSPQQRRPIQYSGLLKSYTLPNEVSGGVFFSAKTQKPR